MSAIPADDFEKLRRDQADLIKAAGDAQKTPFDYIVVGSGAGGGTLAARLARGGRRVLLLEAGLDPSVPKPDSGNPLQAAAFEPEKFRPVEIVPGYHAAATEDPPMAWEFSVRHYAADAKQARDSKYFADKDPSQDGKRGTGGIQYPRCAAIGGCTAHHAMIVIKPNDQDWDRIAALTGDASWRSEAMQGYFARIERCLYYTEFGGFFRRMFGLLYLVPRWIARWINPRYQLDWGGHGMDGWMSTNFVDPLLVRRIAEDDGQFRKLLFRVILYLQTRKGALLSLLRSLVRFRIVQWLDPNILDERMQSYQQLKFIPLAIDKEVRRSGVRDYLLQTAREHPQNLAIVSGAFVERVIFERDPQAPTGAPYARGVVVQYGTHLYEASLLHAQATSGEHVALYAKREVILCGGSFNTPQMLMLSGIGPAAHLAQFGIRGPRDADNTEIAPVVDLPGVGARLQDRYEVSVISEATQDFSTVKGLTFDPNAPDAALAQWQKERKGLYTINGGALAVFATTLADPTQSAYPDLFIFGVPAAFRGYYWNWSKELLRGKIGAEQPQHNLWSWVILKAYTDNGYGTVRLRSANPYEQVEVCFHSFSEGQGDFKTDRLALARGVELTRRLNEQAGVFKNEIQPGAARANGSPALDDWIEDEAWGHHACGTCRMGADPWSADVAQLRDREAVLDSAFRVHGVRGLRVVDASVFPHIPGYFIVTPVLMIGEKAADVLLADDAAYPRELAASENAALRKRRERALAQEGEPENVVGLALSGGGIRSATFCLGVLQAMADKGRVRHVDVLSTVSGGGYIGGFLGRLFTQLDKDVSNPAARVEEILKRESAQIGWLRRYANYIAGEGRSDWINNLGTIWRNLLSLHIVIGLLALAVCLLLRYAALRFGWEPLAFTLPATKTTLQLSPWLCLPVFLIGVWIAPAGLGYWLSQPTASVRTYPLASVLVWFALLLGAIGVLGVRELAPLGAAAIGSLLLAWVWAGVAQWHSARVVAPDLRATLIRNRLTQGLGNGLYLLCGLLVWVALDTAAYTAEALQREPTSHAMSYVAALASAIAVALPAWRALVNRLAKTFEPAMRTMSDQSKLKLRAGAIAFPLVLFGLFAVDLAALWLFSISTHIALAACAVALLFSLAVGRALGFVNMSSLQQGYAARLGRTFLGAANDARIFRRHGQTSADVRAPHAGDDVAFCAYHPEKNGGPLHLVSVCINDTVDSASGRGTREDKGMPMCLGPGGVSVGVRYHALWDAPNEPALRAIGTGNDPNAFHVLRKRNAATVAAESLKLSQWMAISGAAFTTGTGRDTSLPVALAFGLFNVRLGYWWDSGVDAGDRPGQFPSSLGERVRALPARLFRTQATVLSEWRARFFGPSERMWYLSDGGGFDNTGLYELLRRRLPFMLAVDATYDPDYRFEDVAQVMRTARVDFGAEFTWLAPPAGPPGGWARLGAEAARHNLTLPPRIMSWFDPDAVGPIETITRDSAHAAALGYVRYAGQANGSWVLLLKPNLSHAVPPDVRAYAQTHADFPHISTADQFLSEDAWESLRLLGRCIGTRVFS